MHSHRRRRATGPAAASQANESFLDLLAEAALDSALWVPVMERLADLIGGARGVLSRLSMRDGTGEITFARIDPIERERYFAHYALRNPLSNVADPDEYLRTWRPMILTDEDWIPKERLLGTEYYNDFLRRQDMHSVVMIRLAAEGDDVYAVSITRPQRLGQFQAAELEQARALHPHLLRAFSQGRRLAAADAGLDEILDGLPDAILIVDQNGAVRHANAAAERLLCRCEGLAMAGRRLIALRPDAAARLAALIGAATRETPESGAMSLAAPHRRQPLSVIVTPLPRRRAESVFVSQRAAIVTVRDPEAGPAIPEARLRQVFGFTPAEARVALALLAGQSQKQAAESLGLSFFTVRGHLARMFAKTETSRQAELMRLLLRAAS